MHISIPRTVTMLVAIAVLASTLTIAPSVDASIGDGCGDIIIVLDESGSVGGQEPAVRDAVGGMLDRLSGKGSEAAVVEFGTAAVRVSGYRHIDSTSLANVFDPYLYASASGHVYDAPSQTGPYTNWDDALDEAEAIGSSDHPADLVLFITDGEPTAYNRDRAGEDGGITRSTTDPQAHSRAIEEAGAVKATGAHILAVGVGSALGSVENIQRLKDVSGPDVYSGAGEIDAMHHDVILVNAFGELAGVLAAIANDFCGTPDIEIEKTASAGVVLRGSTVNFDIAVTNTGDVDLNNVVVSDPQLPACDRTIGSLPVAATVEYTCSTNLHIDTVNIATVTASSDSGQSVTDTDSASVDVVSPAIDIQKDANSSYVLAGETAVFTITVTNVGDTTLNNVTVSDPQLPACDRTFTVLGVTQSETYECSVALTTSLTNVATATGDGPLGSKVVDDDDATVEVIRPEIDIVKSASSVNTAAGSTVVYTFDVTNTGTVDLTNVTVTDPLFPSCDAVIGALAVGETVSHECSVTLWTAATNVATAEGDGPLGTSATDSDDAVVKVYADGTGTPGYWKNHAERLPVLNGTLIVGDWNHDWNCGSGEVCVELSTDEVLAAISTPPKGDVTYNLSRALVTAWINVSVGNDASCIVEDINTATAWLAAHPVGSGVGGGSDAWAEVRAIAKRLDDYNNGRLCAEHRDSGGATDGGSDGAKPDAPQDSGEKSPGNDGSDARDGTSPADDPADAEVDPVVDQPAPVGPPVDTTPPAVDEPADEEPDAQAPGRSGSAPGRGGDPRGNGRGRS